MTTADEPKQTIAALQERLVELDRERDSVLVDTSSCPQIECLPDRVPVMRGSRKGAPAGNVAEI